MSAFVLVHGAWHGGWCRQQLTPLLHGGIFQFHATFAPVAVEFLDR